MMRATMVAPGFDAPVADAQTCFRAILDAMAHPGRVVRGAPAGFATGALAPALAAACLTLLDPDAPVWLGDGPRRAEIAEWIAFHTGAGIVAAPQDAAFAIITDPTAAPPLRAFRWGTDVSPETGATLLIETLRLTPGGRWILRGPGIAAATRLEVEGLAAGFIEERRGMVGAFPRGVDIVLTAGVELAALPRTTTIEG